MNFEEHRIQSAFFGWVLLAERHEHPELKMLFAVPNGGARDARTGAILKAEGVRRGVPDIVLPIARGGFTGLFLEFKSPTGRTPPEQIAWHLMLRAEGHRVEIVRDADEARKIVIEYLRQHPA